MELELLTREVFEESPKKCKVIPLKTKDRHQKINYIVGDNTLPKRHTIPIPEEEAEMCVALWRGVVMQAIYDISAAPTGYERKILKTMGYSWFASSDFTLVCELAEMNPNKILDLVKLIRCGRLQVQDSKTFKIKRQ